jgi:hypothetical protein
MTLGNMRELGVQRLIASRDVADVFQQMHAGINDPLPLFGRQDAPSRAPLSATNRACSLGRDGRR